MIYQSRFHEHAVITDQLFSKLLIFEWVMGIVFALWISPKTWIGAESQVHIHVYAAIFLGALATLLPVYYIWRTPGEVFNRYLVAISQMVYSIMYIHLTGGRIETHFHIFGSLAFLAFYRDYRPILIATLITVADHLVRGYFFPLSVYGVLSSAPWRALEHAGWILFEDVILIASIKYGKDELQLISKQQNQLELAINNVEAKVAERTKELLDLQKKILEQQQALTVSAKMSALGEMAGGVAHEINTPLAVIQMRTDQVLECISEKNLDPEMLTTSMRAISQTVKRIAKIVSGLRSFARDGRRDPMENYSWSAIVEETFSLCRERFSNHGVKLESKIEKNVELLCRPGELSQVLLNLLNNSYDAIENLSDKWITVVTKINGNELEIRVTDSGPGIPREVRDKMMQPFFTTKEIGKGTGLGLSISRGIIESHRGKMSIDAENKNTCFVIQLPLA